MTKEQQEDLMIEWSLSGPTQQKTIYAEFKASGGNPASKKDFHEFLKDRLEIQGYWKSVDLM